MQLSLIGSKSCAVSGLIGLLALHLHVHSLLYIDLECFFVPQNSIYFLPIPVHCTQIVNYPKLNISFVVSQEDGCKYEALD